jgi:hypothetical protein
MATVTLRGAGGATVTLTRLSDAAAPAAKAVLAKVDQFATLGLLDQVTWPGSGDVPTPSNLLGGLIVQGAGGGVGAMPAQYVSAVIDSSGPATVIGPSNANATMVAGNGGMILLNRSTNADVVLGGGSHAVFQARSGAASRVTVDGALVAGTMDGIGGAAMTISALAGSLTLVAGHGDGKMVVDAADGAAIVTAVDAPVGDAPVTVIGGAGSSVTHLAMGGGAFINPGAGSATVFGNLGSGTTTVFGGTLDGQTAPAFTGSLLVLEGRGVFFGGSAGGNVMTTATVAGAATLMGGGAGDVLLSNGAGNVLRAGAGNATLSGFGAAATVGGSSYFSGAGGAAMFGNSGGGNSFGLGVGNAQVDGRNEAAISAAGLGQGAANTFFVTAPGGGAHVVADFLPGLDRFDMAATTKQGGQTLSGLSFFAADDASAGNPFAGTGIGGTVMVLSGGTAVFFFDAKVTASDII